jgi:copper resistance protein C
LKKAVFLLLLILSITTSHAFAHTGLGESVPKEGEVVTEQLNQLTLSFETKIENGSSLELINQSNETFKPDQVLINNNQLLGQFNSLPNGEYTVIWKIIGADGHIVEGKYAFSLQVPETSSPIEEEKKDGPKGETTEKQTESELNDEKQVEEETKNEQAEKDSSKQANRNNSPLTLVFGFLVIGLLLVGIWRLMQRRK